MRSRHLSALTLFLAFFTFTACSGGSGGNGSDDASSCGAPGVFCLESCNVGCVLNGCEVREIAQNHQLRFSFSQDVDPNTVDFTTISLKTSLGEEPVGQFVVEGSTITFVPDVRTVGASTFFGFTPNQEYVLTLPGGAGSETALRSMTGDVLASQFTCTVRVTQGIVDIDGAPPSAFVVSPPESSPVNRDSEFVLGFSEVIDHAPFIQTPSGPGVPVEFRLLSLTSNGDCNLGTPDAPLIFGRIRLEDDPVAGSTTLTFTPSASLPGGRCVQAIVTARVRDLASTAAVPQSFTWQIDATTTVEGSVVEEFDTATKLDTTRSAGEWSGGTATILRVGGDGRHGDFDFNLGFYDQIVDEYIFNTSEPYEGDDFATAPNDFPAGQYQFTKFEVPAGITVRFRGPNPAIIRVQGICDIRGTVLCDGRDTPQFSNPGSELISGVNGQIGSAGGPGGGKGGDGGDQCDGNGYLPDYDGENGGDMSLLGSHAYAGQGFEVDTGGRGAGMFPSDGLASSLIFNVFSYSGLGANGGGGGGFLVAGGIGEVLETGRAGADPTPIPVPDNPTAGGISFPVYPLAGSSVLEHLALGGAGGGGGSSHPFYRRFYMAGAAGGGGGGVAAFRAGRSFNLAPGSKIDVTGGTGYRQETVSGIGGTFPGCGGGGSGGSCIIQCGTSAVALNGTIDARGGLGGENFLSGPLFMGHNRAGNGSDGLYRIESTGAIDTSGATLFPAPNPNSVAQLTDSDDLVGFVSKFYDTELAVAPVFTRYEIEATIDGVPTTFSDSADHGIQAMPGAAIQFFVQGQNIDPSTGQPAVDESPTEWFRAIGPGAGVPSLNDVPRTGFRFSINADYTVANTVVIDKVSVFFTF